MKIIHKLGDAVSSFFSPILPVLFGSGLLDSGVTSKISNLTKTAGTGVFNTGGTISTVIALLVKAFLSLLGIIFLILILLAGYKWMSAQGEEQKVRDAQDSIKRALIGLAIIFAAYAITYFVFKNLDTVNSGG